MFQCNSKRVDNIDNWNKDNFANKNEILEILDRLRLGIVKYVVGNLNI